MHSLKIIILTTIFLSLIACSGVTKRYSEFNNRLELYTEQGLVYTNQGLQIPQIELKLFWNSELPNDQVVIVAGSRGIKNINDNGLAFNIDGKVHEFSSESNSTKYGTEFSTRNFLVTKKFVQSLLDSDSVKVKVSHLDGTYSEGDFKKTWSGFDAYSNFKKFMVALNKEAIKH